MGVTERKLRTQGKIGKRRVVDSIREALFAASAVDARIESNSHPTVEIMGEAGSNTPRIRFQTATHGQYRTGKDAMNIGCRIKERISAEQLPLRSRLILCRCDRANAAEDS